KGQSFVKFKAIFTTFGREGFYVGSSLVHSNRVKYQLP
ncbi:MAG: hypothetical protein ACI8WB_003154, partial [Phenylobacterium sp.]